MKHEMLSSSLFEEEEKKGVHLLTINEHLAKAYEHRKEREELAKCTSLSSGICLHLHPHPME